MKKKDTNYQYQEWKREQYYRSYRYQKNKNIMNIMPINLKLSEMDTNYQNQYKKQRSD